MYAIRSYYVSKMGNRIETTIKLTATPMVRIITGSIIDVSARIFAFV